VLERQHLRLRFSNGEERRLDVRPFRVYPIFEQLREPSFFALVQPDHGTVS
jgi:hypothetical protein